MTFDEFQKLTTEQKLEVSMAHLAGVLRSQAPLREHEENTLKADNLTVQATKLEKQLRKFHGLQSLLGTFRKLNATNRRLKLKPSLVSESGIVEIVVENEIEVDGLTVRERGAKSAAKKPKPVKST